MGVLEDIRASVGGTAMGAGDQEWLVSAMGGPRTTSGERVSTISAYALTAFYACVRNISEDLGKLPLIVYQREGKKKSRAVDHPIYELLHSKPNPWMSPMSFIETLTQWAVGWHGGLAEITSDGGGAIDSMSPIHPSRWWLALENGVPRYKIRVGDIRGVLPGPFNTITLRDDQVFHIHGIGLDGFGGYDIARIAAEPIGKAQAIQRSAAAFFGNGGHPSGIIEYEGTLSDTAYQRAKASWKEEYGGASASHKTAFLPKGVSWKQVSIDPKASQAIEAAKMSEIDVARLFRMPPHKIQIMDKATFSNIEHQGIEYVTDCLMPWFKRWEGEIQRKLLKDGDFFAEFLADALLRGDTNNRYEAYGKGITFGFLKINEARARENLDPVEGGDDLILPQSMFGKQDQGGKKPDDQDGEDTAQASSQDSPADIREQAVSAIRPLMVDAIERSDKKEEHARGRARTRHKEDPAGFDDWATTFYESHVLLVSELCTPPSRSLCGLAGIPFHESLVLGFARERWAERGRADAIDRTAEARADELIEILIGESQ